MSESQSSAAIRRQLDQLAADLNNQIAIQNTFGQTGQQAIGESFEQLGGKLNTNLGEIKGNVNQGRTKVQGAYDTSQGNIASAEQTLRQLLGGQGALGGEFNSPLQEIQRLSAENAAGRANSLGSYEQLGIGHINAGQMAIGDAATEGTQRKGDLMSQIAAEIAETQRTYLSERSSLEVALAQVLDEERARQEQMALEREKMAQAAREAALDRAAAARNARASGGSDKPPKGLSGVLAWAAQNGIGEAELNGIKQAINAGNSANDPSASYRTANSRAVTNPHWTRKAVGAKKQPRYNLDLVNTGLDIYYGNY